MDEGTKERSCNFHIPTKINSNRVPHTLNEAAVDF